MSFKESISTFSPYDTAGLALAVTLPFGVQALYKSIYFSIAMTKHRDHGSFKRLFEAHSSKVRVPWPLGEVGECGSRQA